MTPSPSTTPLYEEAAKSEIATTRAEREILEHSLGIQKIGGKKTKGGYRNYFAASPGSPDYELCVGLADKGLMRQRPSTEGLVYFHVTDAGKKDIA